jgi:hypothetical protein
LASVTKEATAANVEVSMEMIRGGVEEGTRPRFYWKKRVEEAAQGGGGGGESGFGIEWVRAAAHNSCRRALGEIYYLPLFILPLCLGARNRIPIASFLSDPVATLD